MMRKLTTVLAILSAIIAGCATQPGGTMGMSDRLNTDSPLFEFPGGGISESPSTAEAFSGGTY